MLYNRNYSVQVVATSRIFGLFIFLYILVPTIEYNFPFRYGDDNESTMISFQLTKLNDIYKLLEWEASLRGNLYSSRLSSSRPLGHTAGH